MRKERGRKGKGEGNRKNGGDKKRVRQRKN